MGDNKEFEVFLDTPTMERFEAAAAAQGKALPEAFSDAVRLAMELSPLAGESRLDLMLPKADAEYVRRMSGRGMSAAKAVNAALDRRRRAEEKEDKEEAGGGASGGDSMKSGTEAKERGVSESVEDDGGKEGVIYVTGYDYTPGEVNYFAVPPVKPVREYGRTITVSLSPDGADYYERRLATEADDTRVAPRIANVFADHIGSGMPENLVPVSVRISAANLTVLHA